MDAGGTSDVTTTRAKADQDDSHLAATRPLALGDWAIEKHAVVLVNQTGKCLRTLRANLGFRLERFGKTPTLTADPFWSIETTRVAVEQLLEIGACWFSPLNS